MPDAAFLRGCVLRANRTVSGPGRLLLADAVPREGIHLRTYLIRVYPAFRSMPPVLETGDCLRDTPVLTATLP